MEKFYEMVCFDRLYAPAKGTKLSLHSSHFIVCVHFETVDPEEGFCGWTATDWFFGGTLEHFQELHPELGVPPLKWHFSHSSQLGWKTKWSYLDELNAVEKEYYLNIHCRPDKEWLSQRPRIFCDRSGVVLDVVYPDQNFQTKLGKMIKECLVN